MPSRRILRLPITIETFQEAADDVPIRLELDPFCRELRTHLKSQLSPIELTDELATRIFKKTVDFLQIDGAVRKLKKEVKGRDYGARARLIRTAIELIGDLEKELVPWKERGLPMTEELARALLAELREVKQELWALDRKQRHKKALVDGYMQPGPASQFILQLSDFLAHRLPKFQQQQRDEIIIGVLRTTKLFSGRRDGLAAIVATRRARAIKSEKRARMKEQFMD